MVSRWRGGKKIISAFGRNFEKLFKIEEVNLSKEDCSSLSLLLEIDHQKRVLKLVHLNLEGKIYVIALREVEEARRHQPRSKSQSENQFSPEMGIQGTSHN